MEENNMDSLTTNTPAPTVSTEATQPVQQAQPDKSARFKEKAGLSTLFQTNFFRLFFRYCTGV